MGFFFGCSFIFFFFLLTWKSFVHGKQKKEVLFQTTVFDQTPQYYTITVSIYNQKTKRTDILDKHQPTSTSLSKFNSSKTQLNFCN